MAEKKKAPGIHDVGYWVNKDNDYNGDDKPVKLNPEWVSRVCTPGGFDPTRGVYSFDNVCRYLKPDPDQKEWKTKGFKRRYSHIAPAICVANCSTLKVAEDQRVKNEQKKEENDRLGGGAYSRVPARQIFCSGNPDFKVAETDDEKAQPDYAKRATRARGIKPTL